MPWFEADVDVSQTKRFHCTPKHVSLNDKRVREGATVRRRSLCKKCRKYEGAEPEEGYSRLASALGKTGRKNPYEQERHARGR